MLKKISTITFFLFINSVAVADEVWHQSQIAKIYPYGDGRFVIAFKENSDSCTSSSNPKYHYVKVGENGVTAEGIDKMFSAALTAATTGKQLQIVYDTSTPKCYINRLVINY
ncbi:hypothetical protein [Microbulbifer variabilis]|uniref:hypothetical protein n=1 Tax=Microbulbifer variabilis TaxID=266805 RepID=UPI000366857D|nr:hypothetical protein [Microbulbifer variabilis]